MAVKKHPPYGKEAATNPEQGNDRSIIICAGSDGFARAKNAQVYSWMGSIKHKIALPFGTDPDNYKWPVAGHIVLVCQFGKHETTEAIERLAVSCLYSGAVRVLVAAPDGMTRFLPNKEVQAA